MPPAIAWKVTFTILDAKTETADYSVWVEPTDALNPPNAGFNDSQYDVSSFAWTLCTDLDKVIDGQIVDYGISIKLPLPPGIKSAPEANCDVEEGAKAQYSIRGGLPYKFTNRIPTYRAEYIRADNQPIYSNADVARFFEMHINPEDLPEDWGTGPTDSRGVRLLNIVHLEKNFRARNKKP